MNTRIIDWHKDCSPIYLLNVAGLFQTALDKKIVKQNSDKYAKNLQTEADKYFNEIVDNSEQVIKKIVSRENFDNKLYNGMMFIASDNDTEVSRALRNQNISVFLLSPVSYGEKIYTNNSKGICDTLHSTLPENYTGKIIVINGCGDKCTLNDEYRGRISFIDSRSGYSLQLETILRRHIKESMLKNSA